MEDKLLEIARNFFQTDITQNTKLGDIDGWDSLGHINFFMAIEEAFGKKWTPDEIIQSDSISKIIKLIKDS